MKTTQAIILDAPLRNTLRRQKLGTRNAHVSVLTIQDNSSIVFKPLLWSETDNPNFGFIASSNSFGSPVYRSAPDPEVVTRETRVVNEGGIEPVLRGLAVGRGLRAALSSCYSQLTRL